MFSEKQLPEDVRLYLEEHTELKMWDKPDPMPRELLLQELEPIQGLITSGAAINRELLKQAKELKMVSSISVGYNHFDIEAMREYRVVGTHTPYVLDDTVADIVIGLMLSAARRMPELDALAKRGEWGKGTDKSLFGVDMHHKKLGIIGMGRIGETIAKRAKYGFDMEIIYYNRTHKPEIEDKLNIKYSTMNAVLSESDFIVLMVPLSAETKHLIGEKEFALMKKSAIFINASRGQTVDELALIQALQTKQIHAAGLDVYDKEPIQADNPLLRMSNVVTMPHIGSATEETRHAMAWLAAKNLVLGLKENNPLHVVKELQDI